LLQQGIIGNWLKQLPMWPSVLVQPFQLIKPHGAEQTAGSDMHQLLLLSFRKLLWPLAEFLDTDEKKHNFDIGNLHIKAIRHRLLQGVPFFIYFRYFHIYTQK